MAAKANSGNNSAAILGVVNVVVSLGIGVGGWFAAPAIQSALISSAPALRDAGMSDLVWQIVIAVAFFLIGLMIVSLVISAVAPKDERSSNEAAIAREHNEMMAAKRAKQGRSSRRKRSKR